MTEIFIIMVIVVIIIIYRNYHKWFLSRMERKKNRLEYKDLQFDLKQRSEILRGQIFELTMKWKYNLQFLDVLKEKNAAFNLQEIRLKKIEIMKELASLEAVRLRGLNAEVERQKTEQLLEESNIRLQDMYQQLDNDNSDMVT